MNAKDSPPPVKRELWSMNSEVTLVCCQADAERRLDRAERWLVAYENRFSRFLVTSEMSRLNRSAGRPFRASPALFEQVQLALSLARRSGGVFDPTVLRDLEAAGYDRSIELIPPLGENRRPSRRREVSWRDVEADASTRTISLPAGAGLDLGGIGKGWAVDRLVAILGRPCLVNGGGDVYVAGRPPGDEAWLVGVADPFAPEQDLMVLMCEDRGIATSSTLKRRWRVGDAYLHHLIDPRTGRSSESDAVQVTAVASTGTLADFHAKVALLLGVEAGLRYVDREPEVEGLIVGTDGSRFESGGLDRYRMGA
jgi:thiamine biosynthesis lipoprotein